MEAISYKVISDIPKRCHSVPTDSPFEGFDTAPPMSAGCHY